MKNITNRWDGIVTLTVFLDLEFEADYWSDENKSINDALKERAQKHAEKFYNY